MNTARVVGLIGLRTTRTRRAAPSGAAARSSGWCGTVEPEDSSRFAVSGADAVPCPFRGACDDPAVRDSTAMTPMTVRVIAHIIRTSNDDCILAPSIVEQAIQ